MPRYVYECPKCSYQLELDQKVNERKNPTCAGDDCNIEMDLLICSTNFILNGPRWSRDGYGGKK